MRISVIGCGYLGAVHAAAMAKLGHDVIGIDVDEFKIEELQNSRAPFFEPGLPELLAEVQQTQRLTFSTNIEDAAQADVHFVCVGTPQKHGEFAADLTYVNSSIGELAKHIKPGDVVVGKSTVPVGTARSLTRVLDAENEGVTLLWNPEFLREGHAVMDTLEPDRFVYGVSEGAGSSERAVAILDEVYAVPLSKGTPRLVVSYETSELVKAAANSFLATKISFINAMSEICDTAGADVTELADAIGMDERIGRKFLNAGIGFGGGCLPKDIRAFMARAGELGADQALSFLKEVDDINMRSRGRVVHAVRDLCGGSLIGKRVVVLGAAFKPNSDDVRDSPALSVAAQLQLQGATVTVTDPQALSNARKRFPELNYEPDLEAALTGSHIALLLTEWDEYQKLSPQFVGGLMDTRIIYDGRNVLDINKWRDNDFIVKAIGRP